MAPFSLLTGGANLLFKSLLPAWSCTNAVARYTCVLPSAVVTQVKYLSSQPGSPPKRPLNGYMRYCVQQRPIVSRYNPAIKPMELTKKIAQQWRTMSPEQQRPFKEAGVSAMQQYKLDLQKYQAQLTPAQLQQQTVERREKLAKRRAWRKKRETNILGKPKRPRTALNIFMSENFDDARGKTVAEKMVSVTGDWKRLFNHQKQVYIQLAEDDKIRYKNEMKSWEDHMVEIGREDLCREKTISERRKLAKAKKKPRVMAKASATKGKSKSKAAKSGPTTTVRTLKKR